MNVKNSITPIDIAISGLRAQNKSMEAISSNVANARTTNDGSGQPYRRIEAMFKANDDELGGVELDEMIKDTSDFQRVYDPGNPEADDQGYIKMPNVNLPIELMNLSTATKAYQANAAVLKRYQKMVDTSLELLR